VKLCLEYFQFCLQSTVRATISRVKIKSFQNVTALYVSAYFATSCALKLGGTPVSPMLLPAATGCQDTGL
jgi:hypothetical protein